MLSGKPQQAAFVLEGEPANNRINLEASSRYMLGITLPADFEARRLELLQLKMETIYRAIEKADARLRAHTESEIQLLDAKTRESLIDACALLREEVGHRQFSMTNEGKSLDEITAAIQEGVDHVAVNEERLWQDDNARDGLLPPTLVESLVSQIEDWRTDLNKLKARLVSLELMIQDTNEPYPRHINGWLDTKDQTPYTMSGAIPFVLEDEYLDWIRQDKVVTVVFYDPNEPPEEQEAASYRAALARYWPDDKLMVVEFSSEMVGVPRDAAKGTRPNTIVKQNVYGDIKAVNYSGDGGSERTYLASKDEKKVWVFGPDITSPPNIEVWTVSDTGDIGQRLYPPVSHDKPREVFIQQIAGPEGGVFDPVNEAKRRGKIVAVARLGNKQGEFDSSRVRDGQHPKAQAVFSQELLNHMAGLGVDLLNKHEQLKVQEKAEEQAARSRKRERREAALQNAQNALGSYRPATSPMPVPDRASRPEAGVRPFLAPPPSKGDLNGDGVITKEDADICLAISVRSVEPTEEQRRAADMNGDGYIDSADATLILRAAEGQ